MRDWIAFIGRKLFFLMMLSSGVGIALSLIELSFAYLLQSFLVASGLLPVSSVRIPSWIPYESLGSVATALIFVAALRAITQWWQEYLRGASSEEFRYLQRNRILHWAFSQKTQKSSFLINLFNERTSYAGEAVMGVQQVLLMSSVSALLILNMLLISPVLTGFVCTCAMLLFLPLRKINRSMRNSGQSLSAETAHVNDRVVLGLRNLLLLRIYGLQNRERENAQLNLDSIRRLTLNYFKNTGTVFAAPQLVGTVLLCAATAIALRFQILVSAELLSFFYLFLRFTQNSSAAATAFTRILFRGSDLKFFFNLWKDELRRVPPLTHRSRESYGHLDGPIGWRLKGVGFRYSQDSSWVIRDLDLVVKPGQTLVLTGRSGTGKSTLLQLLISENSPERGTVEVFLNGKWTDLSVSKGEVLTNLGYVGAESYIIDGTILENLVYGLESHPSVEDIRDAIRNAECEFIYELPGGLSHRLTESGLGLSAGQKQRLNLARALLRKPAALILDEATANLDAKTEEKLLQTLTNLKGKLTILIVTHRQTLLKMADLRLDLDGRPERSEEPSINFGETSPPVLQ